MTKNYDKSFGIFLLFTGTGFLDRGFDDAEFKTMMVNEIDPDFSPVYLRKNMKRLLPKYGLQAGDVCCYLECDEKRRGHAKRVRESPKNNNTLVGFIGGLPCPDSSIVYRMGDE